MDPFVHTLRVSWVDTDAAEIVHFSNYFRFFERTEEAFYRSLDLDFDVIIEKFGIWMPRVEAFCQYKAPARFNELIRIEMRIAELLDKAVRYEFLARREENGEEIAQGHIVAVAVDQATGKATSIPEQLRETIRQTS